MALHIYGVRVLAHIVLPGRKVENVAADLRESKDFGTEEDIQHKLEPTMHEYDVASRVIRAVFWIALTVAVVWLGLCNG